MATSSGENTVSKEQYIRGWNVPPHPPIWILGLVPLPYIYMAQLPCLLPVAARRWGGGGIAVAVVTGTATGARARARR